MNTLTRLSKKSVAVQITVRYTSVGKNVVCMAQKHGPSSNYHCPGTQYYGKTKTGEFMTQGEAQREGLPSPVPCAA